MVLGLSLLVPALASASGLTSAQVGAIVSLLQSFNADAGTVAHVQAVLNGQPAPGGSGHEQGQGGGDNENEWNPLATSTTSHLPPPSMMGSTTPPMLMGKACPVLNRQVGLGSKGDDVRQLQMMFAQDPKLGFTASSTGTFGSMTAQAVMRFQKQNGLTATGAVGPLTRKVLEKLCGGEHYPMIQSPMMPPPVMGTTTASTTTH